MDWHQIWEIVSAPDNVPIVALLFFVPFYHLVRLTQGIENDELIAILESDPSWPKPNIARRNSGIPSGTVKFTPGPI